MQNLDFWVPNFDKFWMNQLALSASVTSCIIEVMNTIKVLSQEEIMFFEKKIWLNYNSYLTIIQVGF